MFSLILEIRRRDQVTFLIVEQNAEQALRVADYVYVMDLGRVAARGTAAELLDDPAIERAYLGS